MKSIGLFKVVRIGTISTDREYGIQVHQISESPMRVQTCQFIFFGPYLDAMTEFTEGQIIRLHAERLEP